MNLSLPFIAKCVDLIGHSGQILIGAALVLPYHGHEPLSRRHQAGEHSPGPLRGRLFTALEHRMSLKDQLFSLLVGTKGFEPL